jgi:hypothetical protein
VQVNRLIILLSCTYLILRDILWRSFDVRTADIMLATNYSIFHTPWSRVLLEKLTGYKLVKKFPAFYGTRRFITAFTSACHLSVS